MSADGYNCVKTPNSGVLDLTMCDANVQVVANSSNDLKLLVYGKPTQNDELGLTIGDCAFTVKVIATIPPKFEVVNGPSDDLSLTLQLSDNAITKDGSQERVQCTGGSILETASNGKKQVTLTIKKRKDKSYEILLQGTEITTNNLSPIAEQLKANPSQVGAGNSESPESLKSYIQLLEILLWVYTAGWSLSVFIVSNIIASITIKLVLSGRGDALRPCSKKRGKKDKKETKVEFSKVKFSKVKKPKKKKKGDKAPKESAVSKAN
ncbi:hypothetical protein M3Y94_00695500 [Aphelenchoides besseyi]|nr:hypothetical protein M3Y94_00695500 [Aphelenchoides besseyi]